MLLYNPTWKKNQQDLNEALAAGKAALIAPCPHPRSPAFAIQRIAEDTYYQTEKEGFHPELWLLDLYRMDPRKIADHITWDEDWKCWSDGGEFSVTGKSILGDAVFWIQNGLDLSRSPRDRRRYPEDVSTQARSLTAIALIERSLMPLEGELLRRVYEVDGLIGREKRYFDVWRTPSPSKDYPYEPLFHWAHRDGESLRTLSSTIPITNQELEGFVAPEFLKEKPHVRRLIDRMGVDV